MKFKPNDYVIINCPGSENHKLIGEILSIPITKKGHIWVGGKGLKFDHHYTPSRLTLYAKANYIYDVEYLTGSKIVYSRIKTKKLQKKRRN